MTVSPLYKLADKGVIRLSDGRIITPDMLEWTNEYLPYRKAGGAVDPMPPPPGPTLNDVKAAKVQELRDACQATIFAGFDSSALGSVHHYPAKYHDQANLTASVLDSLLHAADAGWTTVFWCADSGGTWAQRPHTAPQIQQAGTDGKAAIISALNQCTSLTQQATQATTIADVQAIAWV